MQFKFLKAKKTYNYRNLNTGAIIEFSKTLREKEGISVGSMLPPSGKGSKKSRENWKKKQYQDFNGINFIKINLSMIML